MVLQNIFGIDPLHNNKEFIKLGDIYEEWRLKATSSNIIGKTLLKLTLPLNNDYLFNRINRGLKLKSTCLAGTLYIAYTAEG